MKKSKWLPFFVLSMCLTGAVHAAECKCAVAAVKQEANQSEKEPKCPVDAKDGCDGGYCLKVLSEDNAAEYQGRKVLFCCDGCVKEFKKSPDAYAEQVKAQWALIDAKKVEKK